MSQWQIAKHSDDVWIDTILLHGQSGNPTLRLTIFPRYKTSGLSGDEWRFSYGWQCSPNLAARMQGDLAIGHDQNWLAFDTGYGSLAAGCAALFPGVYRSQPGIHNESMTAVSFVRKGRRLYQSTYDGEALPLLMLAGHLPWALVMANDEGLGTPEAWADMERLCTQPGCHAEHVSVYQLKQQYRHDGSAYPAEGWGVQGAKVPLVRKFCQQHLRRGDCGLDDADSNYIILSGPGPDEARGYHDYVTHSRQIIL